LAFKISQHLAKSQARQLIASRTQCDWALSCWKMKNSPDIEYGKRLTEYWQCTNRFCCEVFFVWCSSCVQSVIML